MLAGVAPPPPSLIPTNRHETEEKFQELRIFTFASFYVLTILWPNMINAVWGKINQYNNKDILHYKQAKLRKDMQHSVPSSDSTANLILCT